jgi:hypothetical protein
VQGRGEHDDWGTCGEGGGAGHCVDGAPVPCRPALATKYCGVLAEASVIDSTTLRDNIDSRVGRLIRRTATCARVRQSVSPSAWSPRNWAKT